MVEIRPFSKADAARVRALFIEVNRLLAPRRMPFTQGLASMTLRELTARRVGEFRDALRVASVSLPTARKILRTLKPILDHAISHDLMAINVARDVRVIGRRDEGARRIVPPTKEAVRQVIATAEEEFALRILFAAP